MEATMNFAWISATSRYAAVSLAVSAVGAIVWTGCGSSGATVCDDAGLNCMVCDGYGCSSVQPPNKLDAGFDSGSVNEKDSGKTDAGKTDSGKTGDAGKDVIVVKAACGTPTGGPCPCTSSSNCSSGEECVAGACEPTADVCVYSSQCGGGDLCADGRCVSACSDSTPCATGFTCTKSVCEPTPSSTSCASSSDCPESAPFCISGSCAAACSANSDCPTGDFCDLGACVLNTLPSPNCTTASDCESGQVCQDGFCLYSCNTSLDCEDIDARIPVCVDMVCRSAAEANPTCTTQAQCMAGQDCISNTCQ